MSNNFGVNSEVGKLRKVIVHRPELSLKRLTPSNHDDLLFDDVLWVERAQWEHDQFVNAMRNRGVEVFYHVDLLGEALAASEEARKNVIQLVASEYTVGWSLLDEVREFLSKMQPDILAKHLVGGLTVSEMVQMGFDLAKFKKISLGAAAAINEPDYFVLPPVPNSLFQRVSFLLDLQWRYGQPYVLACPPQGIAQYADDLSLPPNVRGCRFRVLVSGTEL